ncbi:N-acetyltransferase [Streptomyces sp. NPDC013178]|uniref:N-acetyltransferase n=1 Tax=Streptomyces sp. NPDC013178 TaxID=3155118 RepID=UPI0033FAAEEA
MRRRLRIVHVGPDALADVVALHRRCSAYTLWSRYHRAMGDPETYLGTLLGRPGALHLAVRVPHSGLVAIGHVMPDGDRAEVALLVQDGWQNQGLGTRLLRRLACESRRLGWAELYGLVLPGERRISAMLRHGDVAADHVTEHGVTTVQVATSGLGTVCGTRCADAIRAFGAVRR